MTTHPEVPIGSLTHEIDRFVGRVVRALLRPLLEEVEQNILSEVGIMVNEKVTAALGRLSTKIGEAQTNIIAAGAREAGEIKTNLQAVAKQIRDGSAGTPEEIATAIDEQANSVGALGEAIVTGIDALSTGVTIENSNPDETPPAGTPPEG
jgi:hypothetical protein